MNKSPEENSSEEFLELRRLLSLKRHEVPPPRFFDELPGRIMSRIEADQQSESQSRWEAWLDRLFATRWFQPLAAGSMALLAGGLFFLALGNPPNSGEAGRSAGATFITVPSGVSDPAIAHPATDPGLGKVQWMHQVAPESLQPVTPR